MTLALCKQAKIEGGYSPSFGMRMLPNVITIDEIDFGFPPGEGQALPSEPNEIRNYRHYGC